MLLTRPDPNIVLVLVTGDGAVNYNNRAFLISSQTDVRSLVGIERIKAADVGRHCKIISYVGILPSLN